MSKLCGTSASIIAELGKEAADVWGGDDPADIKNDIKANGACRPLETCLGAGAGWIGTMIRQSCASCCRKTVGYTTTTY